MDFIEFTQILLNLNINLNENELTIIKSNYSDKKTLKFNLKDFLSDLKNLKQKIILTKEIKNDSNFNEIIFIKLYESIKKTNEPVENLLKKYDSDNKMYFTDLEFEKILKDLNIEIDNNIWDKFKSDFLMKNSSYNRITISQLVFYLEKYVKEDLKKVNLKSNY